MQLKVYNPQHARRDVYFFEVAEFHYYTGEEVNVKWAKACEMGFKTDDAVGLRIIQRKWIREIDGQPYVYKDELEVKPSGIIEVAGSKGSVYYLDIGQGTCTCPGFTFRGACKHIAEHVKSSGRS